MAVELGIEQGMKLHARYLGDGQYYPAVVVAVSSAKARTKRPVKISYVGFDGEVWVPIDFLKSKKLGLNQAQNGTKSKSKTESNTQEVEAKPFESVASLQGGKAGLESRVSQVETELSDDQKEQKDSSDVVATYEVVVTEPPSKCDSSEKDMVALKLASDVAPTSEATVKPDSLSTCWLGCFSMLLNSDSFSR
mmetsp:Transcript_51494/g.81675  ORF Transcript_51494/g.81675 Transcript_51494/m.81675 type:complete len:193 (+) Transcript_51494:58-636(+)